MSEGKEKKAPNIVLKLMDFPQGFQAFMGGY